MDDMTPDDLERVLARQEQAFAVLERERDADPLPLSDDVSGSAPDTNDLPGNAPPADPRRETARQAVPQSLVLELHDGAAWRTVPCEDIGVGGARVSALPEWAAGPTPARLLSTPPVSPAALCLSDIMWRDIPQGTAGLRFEFLSVEEQALWATCLHSATP